MASIPSPYEKRWQAYLVPNKNDMASMFGPIFYQNGKHTWSLIFLTWQACLVPFLIYMARIPGSSCFEYGLVRNITFLANIVSPPLYIDYFGVKGLNRLLLKTRKCRSTGHYIFDLNNVNYTSSIIDMGVQKHVYI